METDLYIRGECACKYRGNWNWYFIAWFYQPLFLFIDFLLYKSATEEQTNSPELSVLSEGRITYHFLHCGKLIMSEVACSGGLENTTLISTAERRAGLNRNEKINSICLEGYLCRDGFWLRWWKSKQTSSTSKACWIFFLSLQFLIGQEAYFSLNQHTVQILLFYNVIVLVFIGYSLDCSSVIWVNGLCDIISKLISSNKAHQSSMWGGWTMLSSFAGCLWTLWQSCQACCVCVCMQGGNWGGGWGG